MNRWANLCLLSSLMAASSACLQAKEFAWPDGARGAVSLSYDDALDTQLDNAVPTLNKAGLKASFYLPLSFPTVYSRMQDWRKVAEAGHELGNHTLFHACSASKPGRSWVKPDADLDKRTVEQMRQEISTANTFLHALDGRSERTLTPPCLETVAADGDYLPVVRGQFVAVKSAENGLPAGFASYLLPDGQSGDELIEFVKKATASGGMANIVFHGVGGNHLAVSNKAHQELVQFLVENRDVYWTDTYINIMRHVNKSHPQ